MLISITGKELIEKSTLKVRKNIIAKTEKDKKFGMKIGWKTIVKDICKYL